MAVPVLYLLVFLFGLISALPETSWKLVEKIPGSPEGWIQGEAPHPAAVITLRVAHDHPNMAEFQQLAVNVATPGHELYGKHLSKKDVDGWMRPADHVMAAIEAWIADAGILPDDIQVDSRWIKFNATVAQAEQILKTKYSFYSTQDKSQTVVRTLEYYVPADLAPHIELITPTTHFLPPASIKHVAVQRRDEGPARASLEEYLIAYGDDLKKYDEDFCKSLTTPACIRRLYNMENYAPGPAPKGQRRAKIGTSAYFNSVPQEDDFHLFLSAVGEPEGYFNFEPLQGASTTENQRDYLYPSVEIMYAGSLAAPGAHPVVYPVAGGSVRVPDHQALGSLLQNPPWFHQVDDILKMDDEDLPFVLTLPFAVTEQSVPVQYAFTVCNQIMELGLRGVTVIAPSGENGPGEVCETNDKDKRLLFQPNFPASCPFITAVGGTVGIPEQGAPFSGGGFSKYFPRPDWQVKVVDDYLKTKVKDNFKEYFVKEGRGIPDVAAQANNFFMVNKGWPTALSGTGCAAPVFAAIVSNLNVLRMQYGLPTIGFMNPFLYQNGRNGLKDIVQGSSVGCLGGELISTVITKVPGIPGASWNASFGWDAVTGLGTPNFGKLYSELVDLAKEAPPR